MLTRLLQPYGCFPIIMQKLNSCNKDYIIWKVEKIYYLGLYRKFANSDVTH